MFYLNAATKAAVVYCVSNFIAISGKRKCRKYINLSYPIKGRLEFQCGVSDNFLVNSMVVVNMKLPSSCTNIG